MMNHKESTFTKTVCNDQELSITPQAFKMPICAKCGYCDYFEMRGFNSGWCNILRRNTTNDNPECGDLISNA